MLVCKLVQIIYNLGIFLKICLGRLIHYCANITIEIFSLHYLITKRAKRIHSSGEVALENKRIGHAIQSNDHQYVSLGFLVYCD